MGSFCLDPHSLVCLHIAGLILLFTGSLWFVFYLRQSKVNPSDYRGFTHPQTDLQSIMKQSKSKNGGSGSANKMNISDIGMANIGTYTAVTTSNNSNKNSSQ
jgi:hypothetical protein